MNYRPEQGRIHAVIIMKGPEEWLDPEDMCRTKCGKMLPFKSRIIDDKDLLALVQCGICLQASKDRLALPHGYRKVYLREN